MYNLTDNQREILRWIVEQIRAGNLAEEFLITYSFSGVSILGLRPFEEKKPEISSGTLQALEFSSLILVQPISQGTYNVTVLGTAYDAVDSDFGVLAVPDTSFVRHLEPLPTDISKLDKTLAERTLPILATGSTPQTWDQAVRQASIVLEERLRVVGGLTDSNMTGRDLAILTMSD